MAFATKAESRYALTCSILPSVFQRVTQAYRLSKASPTSDQLCEGIVCSTTDATVNTGSENLKLLHRILFVATTDDTDERHYQWAALGAGSVDPSKRGFQDRPVAILAGQGVCVPSIVQSTFSSTLAKKAEALAFTPVRDSNTAQI